MSGLDTIYAGEVRAVMFGADGGEAIDPDLSDRIVLAGSFNPLHDGHRRLVAVASRVTGREPAYEISIENVDKPDLPRQDMEQRLAQFAWAADVVVTRARLFSDKAARLPGAWFVIGYDTAVRLVDDRYYADGDAAADLTRLNSVGVRFVIAGRVGSDGEFRGLNDLEIPAGLEEMFISIPELQFREDVSSTALREQQAQ